MIIGYRLLIYIPNNHLIIHVTRNAVILLIIVFVIDWDTQSGIQPPSNIPATQKPVGALIRAKMVHGRLVISTTKVDTWSAAHVLMKPLIGEVQRIIPKLLIGYQVTAYEYAIIELKSSVKFASPTAWNAVCNSFIWFNENIPIQVKHEIAAHLRVGHM